MALNFAENGKRDIHNSESEFNNIFRSLEDEKWDLDNNRKIILEYLKDCKKGKAKSGGRNKRIGKSTLYRVFGTLKQLSNEWIKKDFDKLSSKEWEQFYDNLESDKILAHGGKRYAEGTKSRIYKVIRKFLKWRYGENKFYPKFCEDWVTTAPVVTKDYLIRSEIDKLVEGASALKVKCMVMMLFDGGFRIEELGNLRWVDVRKAEGKEYYRAHVRPETSKTKKERYVSLWLSTDLIDSLKNSRKQNKGFKESDYLFPNTYNGFRATIKKLGKKVLNKSTSPHTLRHSSATYYASVIKTYQQFCTRYGWVLKSGTAQRYFHAVEDDEIANQSKDHEIARFRTEFERVKLENQQLKKEHKETREKIERLEQMFNDVKDAYWESKKRK